MGFVRSIPILNAVALLLSNVDVVPRYEASSEAMVYHFDASQRFDVGDSIPAWDDQAHREAMERRQRLTVHFVTEEVVAVERFVERHSAGELFRERQVEAAGGIRVGSYLIYKTRTKQAFQSALYSKCNS
jgi:hypothetical protein